VNATALRLANSEFTEHKAVIIFGYEHTPPRIPLDPTIRAFELVASDVVGLHLGPRLEATQTGLMHPFHQQLRVFAWEVLDATSRTGPLIIEEYEGTTVVPPEATALRDGFGNIVVALAGAHLHDC